MIGRRITEDGSPHIAEGGERRVTEQYVSANLAATATLLARAWPDIPAEDVLVGWRITEDGSPRIIESGERRVTEQYVSANLVATAILTASPWLDIFAGSGLVAVSAITATVQYGTAGAVQFAGTGDVTAVGLIDKSGLVYLSATAALSVTPGQIGAATLAGKGTVAVVPSLDMPGGMHLTGTSGGQAVSRLRAAGRTALTGLGALVAHGDGRKFGGAWLAGASVLDTTAKADRPGRVELAGVTGISASARAHRRGAAALAGTSGFTLHPKMAMFERPGLAAQGVLQSAYGVLIPFEVTAFTRYQGAWEKVIPYVRDGGRWKVPTEAYVNRNGAWRRVF